MIELPAVHDPTQAAQVIGQTAQLELYDLTPSLYGPSIDASQNPVPHAILFDLLTLVQNGQKGKPLGLLPLQLAHARSSSPGPSSRSPRSGATRSC